jgi:hypothetical protein
MTWRRKLSPAAFADRFAQRPIVLAARFTGQVRDVFARRSPSVRFDTGETVQIRDKEQV